MTTLLDDPAEFAAASLAAFCAANLDRLVPVAGGAVRRDATAGEVAIVMGGGSGHHPAFAGWVGAGLGDAVVCGNVFSSPSEHQILGVAREADQGGGILFVPINYAGDILHFGAAQSDLRRAGIDARLVAVTDDIASGPPEARETRRGIAGSLIVLKTTGAAARRGRPLAEVERVAQAANDATRSFGVAFSGCTLPGADHPLFSVPEGKMAVGMGIHGEPGIAEAELGTASDVADELVDGMLAERPAIVGQRVAVVVNGLGTTKYDELHLVFGRVKHRLENAGMQLIAPLVGEFMTSLDMSGLSVSIAYLDDELEDLWRDPVDSVALSRGRIDSRLDHPADRAVDQAVEESWSTALTAGTEESHRAARRVLQALESVHAVLTANSTELGRIDAVAGDGDHGIGMVTGATAARDAVRDAVEAGVGAGTALRVAGERWSAAAGGTSGALWGAGLAAAGTAIGDTSAPDANAAGRAVAAYVEEIATRGGAQVGDKTMVDAIVPFSLALDEQVRAGESLSDAWLSAAAAATRAADDTALLSPRRGRSRIHGARSVGTPDAGAVSFALIVEAVSPTSER